MKRHKDILDALSVERKHQGALFNEEYDDKHTVNDWVALMVQQLGLVSNKALDKGKQREHLVKTGALVIAAIESFDRNGGFAYGAYKPREPYQPITTPHKPSSNELLTNAERVLKQNEDFLKRLAKDKESE